MIKNYRMVIDIVIKGGELIAIFSLETINHLLNTYSDLI